MNDELDAINAAVREGRFTAWWVGLCQMRYPPEFRIEEPPWPAEAVGGIEALLAEFREQQPGEESDAPDAPAVPAQRSRALADMATQLWRLEKRLTDPTTGEVRAEVSREHRSLRAALDAVAEVGIEVRDYTGERMPEKGSYTVNVLAFEPTLGISHEIIQETVKPAVYLDGERIQMAEVIVATPKNS